MITAMHTLIYADDPPAARAFFRDVIGWPFVEDPASEPGWLIFQTGPSELGVHPTMPGQPQRSDADHQEVSLMCDDIEATVAELKDNGAEFTRDVRDDGFGLTTSIKIPGGGEIQLYEPRHNTAFNLPEA